VSAQCQHHMLNLGQTTIWDFYRWWVHDNTPGCTGVWHSGKDNYWIDEAFCKGTSIHSLTTPLLSFPLLYLSLYIYTFTSYIHHLQHYSQESMSSTSTSWQLWCPIADNYGPPDLVHTLATSDEHWTD
jgi:hypothetical protein